MAKMMYEYTNVQVPLDAKQKLDKVFASRKKKDKSIRKADLWLEAVSKLKG